MPQKHKKVCLKAFTLLVRKKLLSNKQSLSFSKSSVDSVGVHTFFVRVWRCKSIRDPPSFSFKVSTPLTWVFIHQAPSLHGFTNAFFPILFHSGVVVFQALEIPQNK